MGLPTLSFNKSIRLQIASKKRIVTRIL